MPRRQLARSISPGKAVLEPIFREEVRLAPPVIFGIVASVIVILAMAFVIRFQELPTKEFFAMIGSVLLAPPLAFAGYTFLRDQEAAPHRGMELVMRLDRAVDRLSAHVGHLLGRLCLLRLRRQTRTRPDPSDDRRGCHDHRRRRHSPGQPGAGVRPGGDALRDVSGRLGPPAADHGDECVLECRGIVVLLSLPEIRALDTPPPARAHSARDRCAADRPRAAADRHARVPPPGPHQPVGPGVARLSGGQPHAAGAFAGRLSHRAVVSEAARRRRAVCRGHPAGRCRGVHRRGAACTTWVTGRFVMRSKTSPCPACRRTSCSPTAFCSKARLADALRDDWNLAAAGCDGALVGKAARHAAANPQEHALRADRHRQDGLPGPRQPARRRSLRPQLRPAAADRQLVPERGGRRPGDQRQGANRRRDDGLCPLRHVQRSLLASRRALGHGDAAAGVLTCCTGSSISTSSSA